MSICRAACECVMFESSFSSPGRFFGVQRLVAAFTRVSQESQMPKITKQVMRKRRQVQTPKRKDPTESNCKHLPEAKGV
jgi:hypothetical protein